MIFMKLLLAELLFPVYSHKFAIFILYVRSGGLSKRRMLLFMYLFDKSFRFSFGFRTPWKTENITNNVHKHFTKLEDSLIILTLWEVQFNQINNNYVHVFAKVLTQTTWINAYKIFWFQSKRFFKIYISLHSTDNT